MKCLVAVLIIILGAMSAGADLPKNEDFFDVFRRAGAAQGYDEKIRLWSRAIELYRSNHGDLYLKSAREQLAFALFQKGSERFGKIGADPAAYNQAVDLFVKANEANPLVPYPLEWLFHAILRFQNYTEGVSLFSARVEFLRRQNLPPSLVYALFLRGELRKLAGDEKGSLADFHEGVRRIEDYLTGSEITADDKKNAANRLVHLYSRIARFHFEQWENGTALEFLEKALAADSSHTDHFFWKVSFSILHRISLEAFASGDYDRALAFHERAGNALSKNDVLARENIPGEGWNYFAEIIKARKNLGKIQPAYRHRILSIYFLETRIDATLKNGSRIISRRSITPAMKRSAAFHEAVLKGVVETISSGNLSLHFDRHETALPVENLIQWSYEGRDLISPDISRVQRALGEKFWRETQARYDTVLQYWNGEGISNTATGGAFVSPFDRYTARGFMLLPVNYLDTTSNPALLLHEFFHVVEVMAGISPVHGASDGERHHFPAWKGKGELDYIRWHFSTTVAGKGWSSMNFIARYPVRE